MIEEDWRPSEVDFFNYVQFMQRNKNDNILYILFLCLYLSF